MAYKLGSLFDGSGGFPLAGTLCGIEPVWAAEVEPYPIAVTRSRFPNMKHLGSVTEINGSKIEPVDIITFGSPCQDLSVAGKRAGLRHEANGDEETTRSGLFMEAVRIIKEMREATNGAYPSFALWENVPGAFSSSKGEDFRVVLEELIGIVEPGAVVPPVPKGGWAYADSYRGDGWSLAYRVFDAQWWGVPQRRRRIHLVLDLRGERAHEVLFEREGVRGYFEARGAQGQAAAADPEGGSATDDRAGTGFDGYNADITGDVSSTLGVNCGVSTGRNGVIECRGRGLDGVTYGVTENGDATVTLSEELHACLTTGGGKPGQGYACALVPYTLKICSGCEGGGKGALVQEDKSATPATGNDQYLFQPVPGVLLDDQGGQQINVRTDDKSPTLRAEMHGNVPCIVGAGATPEAVIPIHDQATRFAGKRGDKLDGKGNGFGVGQPGDPMNTLTSADRHAVAFAQQAIGEYSQGDTASSQTARQYKAATDLVCLVGNRNLTETQTAPARCAQYIVRRLTPTECARLQGFPDTWGHPDVKEDFTDDEHRFWLSVRNTHAVINGRATKDYTKAQMLKWYNGLRTDSAEYKLWGNGIALPPALYCMQGITDALAHEEDEDDWLM